jgi:uncharacterized protein YhaN
VSLLVAAALAGAAACAVRRQLFDAALFGLAAAVIGVLRLALRGRVNWVLAEARKSRAQADKLRTQLRDLAARRDADWRRAAEIAEAIRADAARLGLAESPSPEALDQCEQALAHRLRERGADTALGALLHRLLALQDEEQEAVAAAERADRDERAQAGEWDGWRSAARLPEGVDPAGAAERLHQLHSLAATIAVRDAARGEMSALEPEIAAWEAAARSVLQQVGVEVPPDLCGRALTTELAVLGKRIERNRERELRRDALQAEIVEAYGRLEAADAALEQSSWEWNDLIAAAGAANEDELRAEVVRFRRSRDAARRCEENERVIATALDGLDDAAAMRAELAAGSVARWQEELDGVDARLTDIARATGTAADLWQRAEVPLAAARSTAEVPDLLREREEILAALDGAAREWRLVTVARGLVEQSIDERESTRRREVLRHSSRALAALSSGAYAEVTVDGRGEVLWVADGDGGRTRVDGKLGARPLESIYLAVRLGAAARLASLGTPVPLILDDVLAALTQPDAQVAAREIAAAARAHQVLYVTTDAATREILAASGAGAAVPILRI